MLVLLTAALLQGAAASASAQPPAAPTGVDSTAVRDSTRRSSDRTWRRIPVTAEHLRTAFVDSGARELLRVARDARTRQDTSLTAYDATTFQRISAGLGIRRFGRERLVFRQEIASRVRWRRGQGVVIDLIGKRQATPAGVGVEADVGSDIGPIPYIAFPFYTGGPQDITTNRNVWTQTPADGLIELRGSAPQSSFIRGMSTCR